MTGFIAGYVRVVDRINEAVGRAVAWLTLGCVLLCFAVVLLRYGFGIGLIWMQELFIWLFAFTFLLGAGYTLKQGGHVRVDAFYARMSARRRAWVDLIGTFLFLLPWLAVLGFVSIGFVGDSLRINEGSAQPGGMPALYVLKGAIPAFCVLLGAQGLAEAGRAALVLMGHSDYAVNPHETGHGV